MKNRILPFSLLVIAPFVCAEPLSFDFKDPKGVNNVAFLLDAPLESISGTGAGITGTVLFDPEAPESLTGSIHLATSSLMVANGAMREHMMGAKWMAAEEYPEISFEVSEVKSVRKVGDNSFEADVSGTMTIKGQAREMMIPVRITYLPGKLADRTNGQMSGDLLVLRSDFSVLRSEFGINAGQNLDKVADEIELRLSIAGSAVR